MIHGENRKFETMGREIGRYLEKIGSLSLENKKQEDIWRKQET